MDSIKLLFVGVGVVIVDRPLDFQQGLLGVLLFYSHLGTLASLVLL